MPRQNRILFDDAIYHIIQRGHNKYVLFDKDKDYLIFKETVLKYKMKFKFDIYHYCIMSNHFHMLVRVKEGGSLPKVVQGITQSYSFYYRKEYSRTGYVYQGRYKSLLIQTDSYLLECGRYIERNPLRANIIKDLPDYPWSSYNFYSRGQKDDIITENPLYTTLSDTPERRKYLYIQYIQEPRPYEKLLDEALIK